VALTREFASLQQMSADPNLMLELLRHEPCHVAALLQLHQMATATGQDRQGHWKSWLRPHDGRPTEQW